MNGSERTLRIMALRRLGWNETRIAASMGISRQRVHELLVTYGPEIRRQMAATLEEGLRCRLQRHDAVIAKRDHQLAHLRWRRSVLADELAVVRDERQTLEIDRLLGLDFVEILAEADARKMQRLPSTNPGPRPIRAQGRMQGLAAETRA